MVDTPRAEGEAFLALSQFFVDDGTLGDTLLRVAELARDMAPADMAGITMIVEGKPGTVVFTDVEALEIDESQYDSQSGPCLDALRRQQIYRIDSTFDDDRWPEFAKHASSHGILSTLSIPIVARGEGLGGLNLYARRLSAFHDDDAQRMFAFARHAAIVLANTQVYWDAHQLSENLSQAMRSRSTIDFATGILMATGGRKPQEAFQLLVRASQRENRKLRDIASELVERTVRRENPTDSD